MRRGGLFYFSEVHMTTPQVTEQTPQLDPTPAPQPETTPPDTTRGSDPDERLLAALEEKFTPRFEKLQSELHAERSKNGRLMKERDSAKDWEPGEHEAFLNAWGTFEGAKTSYLGRGVPDEVLSTAAPEKMNEAAEYWLSNNGKATQNGSNDSVGPQTVRDEIRNVMAEYNVGGFKLAPTSGTGGPPAALKTLTELASVDTRRMSPDELKAHSRAIDDASRTPAR